MALSNAFKLAIFSWHTRRHKYRKAYLFSATEQFQQHDQPKRPSQQTPPTSSRSADTARPARRLSLAPGSTMKWTFLSRTSSLELSTMSCPLEILMTCVSERVGKEIDSKMPKSVMTKIKYDFLPVVVSYLPAVVSQIRRRPRTFLFTQQAAEVPCMPALRVCSLVTMIAPLLLQQCGHNDNDY